MKSRSFRLCSMLLAVALLLNMLPMGVFAQEYREAVANAQISAETTELPENSEACVVDEIIRNRTEFSKEFLLSNGLHMAVVYPDAVHYETDNGWEEIDNTLITKADGTLTNTAGVWDVSFPQQLDESGSVTIEKDGYTLSFSMAGELNSTGAALMTAGLDTKKPAQPLRVEEAKASKVQRKETDISALKQAAQYPETVPEKLQSGVTYNEVYEDTHITYDLASNKVKESVILESYKDTLQGYRYTLQVGEMIPVLEDNGQITLYDKTQETVIMVMPAPYLLDDAGEYNSDIQVQLEGSGSEYTMTYLLPTHWLAEETRAWPVVLDPVVTPTMTTTNIRDITVFEKESNYASGTTKLSENWGMLQVGYYSTEGKTRTFLKYNDLPDLTSSDVIVHASVQMYAVNAGTNTQVPVNVHKVSGSWESGSITWANKPSHSTDVEDFAIVDDPNWYGWVITDIVRDWYANSNTGMMFKASDAIESAATNNFKQFFSSDFSDYNGSKPVLTIQFRNNNGLESYWDYTSSSAGRAGTGHVNNFTGNMIWVREDIGFGGNRMPVAVSHIYNLNDAIIPTDSNNSNDTGGNAFGMGIGWRTNFNQLIYRWNMDSSYYIWEDSDGTDHYFKQKDGVYKDEDGLELTLTDTGSGTKKYCIEDKDGNRTYFDTEGRLSLMENNQETKSSITVTYGTGKQISSVTDGAGRVYDFIYTGDLLSKIRYRGSGNTEISYVSFGYSNSCLTTVTDADGKSSTYTYDNGGLMRTASDIDGYKLAYSYNTITESWKPYRVLSVEETDGTASGGKLTFAYGHNQTTVTDHNGNKQILQFNDFGNLISTQDDEGKAQFAQYAFDTDDQKASNTNSTAKGNQLRVESKLQNTVGNRLKDNSFEAESAWHTNSSALTATRSTETAYFGEYSLKLVSTTEDNIAAWVTGFSVEPGATYIFSAYVKTEAAKAIIALQNSSNYATYMGTHQPQYKDWARLQVAYSNTSNVTQKITPILFITTAGTAYMDGVQVEKADMPSRYNLLDNGDFRYPGEPAYGWNTVGLTAEDTLSTVSTPAAPGLENTVLKITGNPTGYKQLMNYPAVSGGAGDSYVISGWAKGNSVCIDGYDSNPREFSITVALNNYDGTSTSAVAKFNPDTDQWQYSAAAVVAEKGYHSITVIIKYNFNANTVYFDGIQLYKEEFGNSYTYDDDGNVIAVKDLQAQTTTYEYDTNSNLTKVIQNNKAKMTYTYDSCHNVKSATTGEGLVYDFTYDTYGNNTAVSISNGGTAMTSTATYSADGNRLVSTTNALGKVTTYGYNDQTNVLDWVQYPEDTEDTRTEYSYDSIYRVASAACETDTGSALSAAYTYTDDLLTKIQTPSTTYSFSYGDFSLRTGVSIGNRTLATYSYTNDRNHYLSALDYGNEDSVNYTYDDKGRLTGQTYEDGDTVAYTYNNNGALAKLTDSATGITTTYYYDLTDRLMMIVEGGSGYSHNINYEYDVHNNLTKLIESINGVVHTATYAYDDDNRVTSVTEGEAGRHYTYDAFGRVSQQTTKHNGSDILTQSATFQDPTAGKTAAQVATYTLDAAGYDVAYSYTYDDNGNITSISDGTNTTSYVYDSANQLIRENNQAGGFTYVWEYDNAGNILSRKEYSYTTGELGTPTDTVTYTYGDSQWGDLLTAYDGNTITYDQIGNPLTDGTWTYTWEHGRELLSMTDGTTTWSHTYNADGLRTQRTNGTTTYSYVYNGGSLRQLTKGNDTLYISYDASGAPMSVSYNGTPYYYATNIQGDITAILNTAGTAVVSYTYDAWGNILSITGSMADSLGQLNPLRYRGYVYDNETRLYYLQSRYYNPEIGRFINADALVDQSSVLGYNLFTYCRNNPVNMTDTTGNLPFLVVTAAIGAVFGAVVGGVVAAKSGGNVWAGIGVGAAAGGLIGLGVGAAAGIALAGSATASTVAVAAGASTFTAAVATGGAGAGVSYISNNISSAFGSFATTATQTVTSGKGFKTFTELKQDVGSAGTGNEWHHIVEQCQINKSGFTPQMIHNTNNIIAINKTAHRAISGYYSSIQPFTNGLRVRDWLAGQSFEAQYMFGLNVIELFK